MHQSPVYSLIVWLNVHSGVHNTHSPYTTHQYTHWLYNWMYTLLYTTHTPCTSHQYTHIWLVRLSVVLLTARCTVTRQSLSCTSTVTQQLKHYHKDASSVTRLCNAGSRDVITTTCHMCHDDAPYKFTFYLLTYTTRNWRLSYNKSMMNMTSSEVECGCGYTWRCGYKTHLNSNSTWWQCTLNTSISRMSPERHTHALLMTLYQQEDLDRDGVTTSGETALRRGTGINESVEWSVNWTWHSEIISGLHSHCTYVFVSTATTQ